MASTGYIQVNAYTSNARIPLKDVAITVTSPDGTVIGTRITNRSGQIEPISIPVPDIEAGQTPNTGELPFTRVNIYARSKEYVQIENEDVQVFPNITTRQALEMIPLSELPVSRRQKELFITPAQNL